MKRARSGPAGDESVSLVEAAELLGVAEDVLLEALVEHGLGEAEARSSRLLRAELDNYRRHLHGDDDGAAAALSALREVLDE